MMTEIIFSPGLLLIVGAILMPIAGQMLRTLLLLGMPLVTLAYVWWLPEGGLIQISFLGYVLEPVKSTVAGRLFATVFCIMAFAGGLYGLRARTIELTTAFVYAGAAVCVTFAGDLISLFVFWELMALSATLVIWSAGSRKSYKAGFRYLLIHLGGGVVLMTGITAHVVATGSIAFVSMQPDNLADILILIGFLFNAGAPPLSAWIADAYPEASYSGTVFLSAFTTKAAVYALLVGFPGASILVPIGLYMVFYGIIYALLENDMRRILAYSIVNQVGFMVAAIGIGTETALNGAAAHAFAHIIYKGLLLMSAGSVLFMTAKRKCTDLGGLFQSMPVTAFNGIIGALSISAFPFTSGFVTKSLETAGAAEQGMVMVWLLLMAASAGVFLHAGIKFPWFVFFQKDSGLRPPDPPFNMRLAMWLFSFLCLAIGFYPQALYRLLPYTTNYQPYTLEHIVAQLQLLLFAGFAFFVMLKLMRRTLTISLDFDWFYRKFFKELANEFTLRTTQAHTSLRIGNTRRVERFIAGLYVHHGPKGVLARVWSTGGMVILVVVLLCLYLVLYYL